MAALLEGTSGIVTGAGSGLGKATAVRLHGWGASPGLLDINSHAVSAAAAELGSGAFGISADVTDVAALRAAMDMFRRQVGPLRFAVACHGILNPRRILDRDGEARDLGAFARVVNVNLVGTFNLLALAAEQMARNPPDDDGERGVVVLTASIAAWEGQTGQAAYSASKSGITGLVLPAARDLAQRGIRVCAVAPGTFDTPMLSSLPEPARAALAAQIPFPNRLGRPEEFARMVRDIIENGACNGATYRLDGALRLSAT